MKLHSFVSCVLAACSFVVFPELSQGHGGGGGGGGGSGGGGGGGGGGHSGGGGGHSGGGGGHSGGGGSFGGHGFGRSFAGVSGRGFGSGFRGARGFADRGFFGRADHNRFGDRGFRGRDFGDRRFDRDFVGFGFDGFGYPYYYPYYDYPYYYPYPYYSNGAYLGADNYGDYSSGRSDEVASLVQSELSKRGYYRGPIDGVIGAGSRRAIRSFQTDQRLPATGSIDTKLIKALRIG